MKMVRIGGLFRSIDPTPAASDSIINFRNCWVGITYGIIYSYLLNVILLGEIVK